MDFQALIEALTAVLVTPVVSIAMVLVVFVGLALVFRKVYRR